ncbi:MAG: sulfite exporter TauE/SafE family protein [Candidatus Heimdallarchaeota archaeon]|nr:sulfite exporter TauE/SafE family protein [Candidatus Heimdallarchaeota archaeon]
MSLTQIFGDLILNNPIEGIFFTIFAFFVGILSSVLGVGGGFITTPSLILMGVQEAYAVGTVLVMIIFTALSSSIAYYRSSKLTEYRTGLLVAITTVIGAIAGSTLSSIMATQNPALFRVVFAVCLIPIAIKMIIFPKQRKKGGASIDEIEHDEVIWLGFEKRELYCTILGLIGGFSSGLLGIGGGVLMVPILVHVGKLSMHKAVATSMFIMIFTSIAGAVVKLGMGQVHPDLAFFLIIGIIIGAQIGPYIIKRIQTTRLQQIFGCMMIIALISIAIGRDQIVRIIQEIFLLV